MSSIISKENLAKIEKLRKNVLKVAIWLLVGGVVLGAITILFGGVSSGEIIGKFMGTMLIVALMMIVSVNNFKRVASEDMAVQIFALTGLVSNLIWALLWILLCWVPELGQTCTTACMRCTGYSCGASILLKFAAAFSYLSILGLIGSNVLAMYEGNKRNLIRPLKITGVVCATYEFLYLTVMTFSGFDFASEFAVRLGMLAMFTGFAWFAIVIAALIISSNEKTKDERKNEESQSKEAEKNESKDAQDVRGKTDDELRAEIEERVRKEMIEKEVRAKIEAEMAAKKDGIKEESRASDDEAEESKNGE